MPFLGERHQYWVNDIKQIRLRGLSMKDRWIVMLCALLILTLGLYEFNWAWTQSLTFPRHSWRYLNATEQPVPSALDQNWSDEKVTTDAYWIKSELFLKEDGAFDVLQVSFSESYEVYWDGYLVGTHDHVQAAGVTQLYLLEKHHVLAGAHHIMVHVQHPRSVFLDLSKKQFLLGKEEQIHMMAVMKLFLLIGALGILGIIILLFTQKIRSFHSHPKATLWTLAIFSIYLGLSLVDTLHHQPFQWSNPTLLAIATACSLQLVFTLSRHTTSLLFKSFFSIAAATYILVYFILGTANERLILYDVALFLTLFFFLYTTAERRASLLWSLVPLLPFLPGLESFGFFVLVAPLVLLMTYQLFHFKPIAEHIPEEPETLPQNVINYLLVNSKSDKKSIPLETVAMVKAANNYSIIILTSGETFLHDKSLLKLSSELPENFKRVHKSFLVNIDQIEQVKNKPGGGKMLQMKNDEEVPVGRVYQKELTARFA